MTDNSVIWNMELEKDLLQPPLQEDMSFSTAYKYGCFELHLKNTTVFVTTTLSNRSSIPEVLST